MHKPIGCADSPIQEGAKNCRLRPSAAEGGKSLALRMTYQAGVGKISLE